MVDAKNAQGKNNEARLLGDEHFLRKVAVLYYEERLLQEEIAEMEGCLRQTVSKALQRAKDKGIVRISVVPDVRAGFLRHLSREVCIQLDLEDLVLVSGRTMDTVAQDEIMDDVVADISRAAAEYLDQMLTDSDILAVSGGRTFLRTIVRSIRPTKVLPHLQVVPMIGFVEACTTCGDANLIADDLALAYKAAHIWFPAPAFVPDQEQRVQMRTLPIMRDAYEMMTRANVLIMGLWTPHTNNDMIRRGILTPEQVETISAYRPVVDINHWVFDADGECINTKIDTFPYTISGLAIPTLTEKIQYSNTKVILVAGGSPSYIPAIRAVLKARLANILITDHITGQSLLMEDH